jgi:hypothetical protein
VAPGSAESSGALSRPLLAKHKTTVGIRVLRYQTVRHKAVRCYSFLVFFSPLSYFIRYIDALLASLFYCSRFSGYCSCYIGARAMTPVLFCYIPIHINGIFVRNVFDTSSNTNAARLLGL